MRPQGAQEGGGGGEAERALVAVERAVVVVRRALVVVARVLVEAV